MSENTTMLRRVAGVAAIAALAIPGAALADDNGKGNDNGKGKDHAQGQNEGKDKDKKSDAHGTPPGHIKDADWCARPGKADHWKCTPEDDKPGKGPKPDKPGKGNDGNNGNNGNNGKGNEGKGNDGKNAAPTITIINNIPAAASAGQQAGVSQQAASKALLPCTSRRRFRVHLGVGIRSAKVTLNGRRMRVVRHRKASSFSTIDLRRMAKGIYTVRTAVVKRNGKLATGTRRYRTCA